METVLRTNGVKKHLFENIFKNSLKKVSLWNLNQDCSPPAPQDSPGQEHRAPSPTQVPFTGLSSQEEQASGFLLQPPLLPQGPSPGQEGGVLMPPKPLAPPPPMERRLELGVAHGEDWALTPLPLVLRRRGPQGPLATVPNPATRDGA